MTIHPNFRNDLLMPPTNPGSSGQGIPSSFISGTYIPGESSDCRNMTIQFILRNDLLMPLTNPGSSGRGTYNLQVDVYSGRCTHRPASSLIIPDTLARIASDIN